MRLCTFEIQGQQELCAMVNGDRDVVRLQAADTALSGEIKPALADMLAFLQADDIVLDQARAAIEFAVERADPAFLRKADTLLQRAPLPRPESIREFMTFEQHVINCGRRFGMKPWRARLDEWIDDHLGRRWTRAFRENQPWYERPVYYKGNRFAVVGHDKDVIIPAYTQAFDWELEFGILLRRGGRNISVKDARKHVGGYLVFNDFSARDIQAREMGGRLGPAKGKDFDTGNAMGPVLVTPDEVPDPYNLKMTARINGQEVSRGHSSGMRFSFEDILAYVSQDETLYPGEFFGSGTATVPESGKHLRGCGVEMGRFLKAGDVIELEVETLGILRNRIVSS